MNSEQKASQITATDAKGSPTRVIIFDATQVTDLQTLAKVPTPFAFLAAQSPLIRAQIGKEKRHAKLAAKRKEYASDEEAKKGKETKESKTTNNATNYSKSVFDILSQIYKNALSDTTIKMTSRFQELSASPMRSKQTETANAVEAKMALELIREEINLIIQTFSIDLFSNYCSDTKGDIDSDSDDEQDTEKENVDRLFGDLSRANTGLELVLVSKKLKSAALGFRGMQGMYGNDMARDAFKTIYLNALSIMLESHMQQFFATQIHQGTFIGIMLMLSRYLELAAGKVGIKSTGAVTILPQKIVIIAESQYEAILEMIFPVKEKRTSSHLEPSALVYTLVFRIRGYNSIDVCLETVRLEITPDFNNYFYKGYLEAGGFDIKKELDPMLRGWLNHGPYQTYDATYQYKTDADRPLMLYERLESKINFHPLDIKTCQFVDFQILDLNYMLSKACDSEQAYAKSMPYQTLNRLVTRATEQQLPLNVIPSLAGLELPLLDAKEFGPFVECLNAKNVTMGLQFLRTKYNKEIDYHNIIDSSSIFKFIFPIFTYCERLYLQLCKKIDLTNLTRTIQDVWSEFHQATSIFNEDENILLLLLYDKRLIGDSKNYCIGKDEAFTSEQQTRRQAILSELDKIFQSIFDSGHIADPKFIGFSLFMMLCYFRDSACLALECFLNSRKLLNTSNDYQTLISHFSHDAKVISFLAGEKSITMPQS